MLSGEIGKETVAKVGCWEELKMSAFSNTAIFVGTTLSIKE